MTNERRRMPRQKLSALAALETKEEYSNNQALCAVVDVSEGGIGLRTGQPPAIGQHVLLRLAIEEEIQTIRARVTRVDQTAASVFEVGLDWSKCRPEERKFLTRYVLAQANAGRPGKRPSSRP